MCLPRVQLHLGSPSSSSSPALPCFTASLPPSEALPALTSATSSSNRRTLMHLPAHRCCCAPARLPAGLFHSATSGPPPPPHPTHPPHPPPTHPPTPPPHPPPTPPPTPPHTHPPTQALKPRGNLFLRAGGASCAGRVPGHPDAVHAEPHARSAHQQEGQVCSFCTQPVVLLPRTHTHC